MTAELDCIELVELVTDYLEQALDPATRHAVEEHLAGCGGCEAYLAQIRTTIALTGRLEPDDVPAPVLDAVVDAFRRHRRAG